MININQKRISWSRRLLKDISLCKKKMFFESAIQISMYRPFYKQNIYYHKSLNEENGQLPKIFPTLEHPNLVICVSGIGGTKDFSALITNLIPDIQFQFNGQCFPLYYYESKDGPQRSLFDKKDDDYICRDGLTDFILEQGRSLYGPKTTKEDVFYYVYGLLHSHDYRLTFAADLKKMLPRLPLVKSPADFWAFSKAGRTLADLHLNYEAQPPPAKIKVHGAESGRFEVQKMRFPDKADKSVIEYNPWIKISGIPPEAYDYVVNGRPAIEWIMERYQVKTDKDSGIKNDPNDWTKEHGQPRYILDLLLSVVTVSLETVKIVDSLPKLDFNNITENIIKDWLRSDNNFVS